MQSWLSFSLALGLVGVSLLLVKGRLLEGAEGMLMEQLSKAPFSLDAAQLAAHQMGSWSLFALTSLLALALFCSFVRTKQAWRRMRLVLLVGINLILLPLASGMAGLYISPLAALILLVAAYLAAELLHSLEPHRTTEHA